MNRVTRWGSTAAAAVAATAVFAASAQAAPAHAHHPRHAAHAVFVQTDAAAGNRGQRTAPAITASVGDDIFTTSASSFSISGRSAR